MSLVTCHGIMELVQSANPITRFVSDEDNSHFLLALLSCANILLIVVVFFMLLPAQPKIFTKIIPIQADTPVVRFSLISPAENSQVSGKVALITTISNGPQIKKALLEVDGREVQSVFTQETEKLIVFWDTTGNTNGKHSITISAHDNQGGISQLFASFDVQNETRREKPLR